MLLSPYYGHGAKKISIDFSGDEESDDDTDEDTEEDEDLDDDDDDEEGLGVRDYAEMVSSVLPLRALGVFVCSSSLVNFCFLCFLVAIFFWPNARIHFARRRSRKD